MTMKLGVVICGLVGLAILTTVKAEPSPQKVDLISYAYFRVSF